VARIISGSPQQQRPLAFFEQKQTKRTKAFGMHYGRLEGAEAGPGAAPALPRWRIPRINADSNVKERPGARRQFGCSRAYREIVNDGRPVIFF
jgi:hypothetical protein